MKLQISPLMVQ